MYDQRIKVFFAVAAPLLLVCLGRLIQMQLQPRSELDQRIETLKGHYYEELNTVRGSILDRNKCELARDEVHWKLVVSYWELTKYQDPNLQTVLLNRARNPQALKSVETKLAKYQGLIDELVNRCATFGQSRSETLAQIEGINTKIWDQRLHFAWRQNCKNSPLGLKYQGRLGAVPLPEAKKDFIEQFPQRSQRLEEIGCVAIKEMKWDYPLLELSQEQVAYAQQEFSDIPGVSIKPVAERVYPYRTAAAQLIGWTGSAQPAHLQKLFAHDPLARYLNGEICGRMDGVEYVCEAVLRGRRGQEVTDIDGEISHKTDTRIGQNVTLTLDIQLQADIEQTFSDYAAPAYWTGGIAAVVIDVVSTDILAMVSLPTYDLNRARYDYGDLLNAPNIPLSNRCLKEHYKPGSVAKPITLVAGLEGHHITPQEPISCPSHPAPRGWPNCWIWRGSYVGHDYQWTNTARNALKGSCNIYFSHLAHDRLDPRELQQWLFNFGYGQQVPFQYPPLPDNVDPNQARHLQQSAGQMVSKADYGKRVTSFDQIGTLNKVDTRLVGMGEGNLWATVLQAANGMATFARSGVRINPRLFILSQQQMPDQAISGTKDLNLSPETLATIYDGLSAVINETGGTGHEAFVDVFGRMGLDQAGVKVWGKTGSTQEPENAWFGGFAKDQQGRQIALALIVEGGQSGSRDASPLGAEVIRICIEHGYLGTSP